MKKFEVGQKVYSLAHGWGEVEEIRKDNSEFPIMVNFRKSGVYSFTENGRLFSYAPVSLFHYEPEIVEPKWQPKEGEWCWFWDNGDLTASGFVLGRFRRMNGKLFISTNDNLYWDNCAPFPIEHLPEPLKDK